MKTLKELVANNQRVEFLFYKHGELWYTIDGEFEFPVPVADAGDGTFLVKDKAILFMRYIRKHLENIEAGKSA